MVQIFLWALLQDTMSALITAGTAGAPAQLLVAVTAAVAGQTTRTVFSVSM